MWCSHSTGSRTSRNTALPAATSSAAMFGDTASIRALASPIISVTVFAIGSSSVQMPAV